MKVATARTQEPVIANGTFATLGGSLVPILAYLGVQSDTAGRVGSFAGVALALVFSVWHLVSGRSKVMPVTGNAATNGILAEAREVLALLQQVPNSAELARIIGPSSARFSTSQAGSVQFLDTAAVPPSVVGGVVEQADGTLAPAAAPQALEEPLSGTEGG